jgi:hypothetical protein
VTARLARMASLMIALVAFGAALGVLVHGGGTWTV